jgi:hypothetical protein
MPYASFWLRTNYIRICFQRLGTHLRSTIVGNAVVSFRPDPIIATWQDWRALTSMPPSAVIVGVVPPSPLKPLKLQTSKR